MRALQPARTPTCGTPHGCFLTTTIASRFEGAKPGTWPPLRTCPFAAGRFPLVGVRRSFPSLEVLRGGHPVTDRPVGGNGWTRRDAGRLWLRQGGRNTAPSRAAQSLEHGSRRRENGAPRAIPAAPPPLALRGRSRLGFLTRRAAADAPRRGARARSGARSRAQLVRAGTHLAPEGGWGVLEADSDQLVARLDRGVALPAFSACVPHKRPRYARPSMAGTTSGAAGSALDLVERGDRRGLGTGTRAVGPRASQSGLGGRHARTRVTDIVTCPRAIPCP